MKERKRDFKDHFEHFKANIEKKVSNEKVVEVSRKLRKPAKEFRDGSLLFVALENMKAFERCVVGGIPLRNRIAMAPMTRRFNKEDGIPRQAKVDYYQRRAKGEVSSTESHLTLGWLDSQRRDSYRLSSFI